MDRKNWHQNIERSVECVSKRVSEREREKGNKKAEYECLCHSQAEKVFSLKHVQALHLSRKV